MQFIGDLESVDKDRVARCDALLTSADRLRALHLTGLMGTPTEAAFDRLAHLAARILRAPLTIVSLVSDTKQFFKAAYGLPEPYNMTREIPIDGSICRYTLHGHPIIVEDASVDPFLSHHPATKPWGIGAFVALPMVTPEGHVLGAFCAVDVVKRRWTEDELYALQELTASVMTEIALRVQLQELQKQRHFRERLLTSITHDLRTPITASALAAQLLVERVAGQPALLKNVRRVITNMDRADRMIGDLLDASRVESGEKMPVEQLPCDLSALVQNTLGELAEVHGPRVTWVAPPQRCEAHCDAGAMRRVVENLVSNAVKYGKAEGRVTVRLKQTDGHIVLTVHNWGTPIPTDEQLLLFELFRRSTSAREGHQRGWGIGLGLVRGLIEAHDGEVSVQSDETNGTTFTVRMPKTHLPPSVAAEGQR